MINIMYGHFILEGLNLKSNTYLNNNTTNTDPVMYITTSTKFVSCSNGITREHARQIKENRTIGPQSRKRALRQRFAIFTRFAVGTIPITCIDSFTKSRKQKPIHKKQRE